MPLKLLPGESLKQLPCSRVPSSQDECVRETSPFEAKDKFPNMNRHIKCEKTCGENTYRHDISLVSGPELGADFRFGPGHVVNRVSPDGDNSLLIKGCDLVDG